MLIQKLRLQHGWSQQQLADLSGLSVRTIQRIEGGQGGSTESMKSLAAVFEIDFSSLLPESNNMATNLNSGISTDEALALEHVRKLKRFYLHLIQYLVAIGLLTIVNLIRNPHHLWVLWVAGGWGIGLFSHALRTFDLLPFFGPDWERRQVEKRLGKPLSPITHRAP